MTLDTTPTNLAYEKKVNYIREVFTDISISETLETTITDVRLGLPNKAYFDFMIDQKYGDALSRYEEHSIVPFKIRVYDMLKALQREYKATNLGRALSVSDTTVKRILKQESARITFPFFLEVERLYNTALRNEENAVDYIPLVRSNTDERILEKMNPKRKMAAIRLHPDYKEYGTAARELFKERVDELHQSVSIASIARNIGVSNSYFREALYGDFSDEKMNMMYNILILNY